MEIENESVIDRRQFGRGALGLGGAALLGAVALGAANSGQRAFAAQGSPFADDVAVLNYALTLEHFEAALYAAVNGSGKLQGDDAKYVSLFGNQEAQHVQALIPVIQQLGGTPVQPAAYKLPALDTRDNIMNLLNIVEQTGVGAYLGAAGYIKNKDLLAAAASIMQVEARHTAVIRELLNIPPVPDAFTPAFTPQAVIDKVKPFFPDGYFG